MDKFEIVKVRNNRSPVSKILSFLKLPKEEQKKILSEQAEESKVFYAEDNNLKEFRDAGLNNIEE